MKTSTLPFVLVVLFLGACAKNNSSGKPAVRTYQRADLSSASSDRDGYCNAKIAADITNFVGKLQSFNNAPTLDALQDAADICEDLVNQYGDALCTEINSGNTISAERDFKPQCDQLNTQVLAFENGRAPLDLPVVSSNEIDQLVVQDVAVGKIQVTVADAKKVEAVAGTLNSSWVDGRFIQNGKIVSRKQLNPLYPGCALHRGPSKALTDGQMWVTSEATTTRQTGFGYYTFLKLTLDRSSVAIVCGKAGRGPITVGDLRTALDSFLSFSILK